MSAAAPATLRALGGAEVGLAPLPASVAHLAALGWAFTDPPAIQAYQRATGESLAMAFWKYRKWAEENLIGSTQ